MQLLEDTISIVNLKPQILDCNDRDDDRSQ